MTHAEHAEQLHKEGRSITPATLRREFHARNIEAEGVWVMNDGSRGYFSSIDKVEFVDYVESIPEYNNDMQQWIQNGQHGPRPEKRRRVVKHVPAFVALKENESVATVESATAPMASPAPTAEPKRPARQLHKEA